MLVASSVLIGGAGTGCVAAHGLRTAVSGAGTPTKADQDPSSEVEVVPSVVPLKQPTPNSCWATVYTMIRSWADQRQFSIGEALHRVGSQWVDLFNADKGLPPQEFVNRPFITAADLGSEPPANYLPEAYVGMLWKYGPLWIATGNLISSHARLLTGASIKHKTNVVAFRFIDPATGQREEEDFAKFFSEFEAEARQIIDLRRDDEFRLQIIHL